MTLRDGTKVRHRGRWGDDILPFLPFIQRLADVRRASYTDDYIRELVNPGDITAENLWSWITGTLCQALRAMMSHPSGVWSAR